MHLRKKIKFKDWRKHLAEVKFWLVDMHKIKKKKKKTKPS